jgi:site-specific recombinase XerD
LHNDDYFTSGSTFVFEAAQTSEGAAASIRSYRDTVRLFLCCVAQDQRRRITQITLQDLTFERAQQFLQHLEVDRHNHIRTRNQRLAALRTFFDFVAYRVPEMLPTGQQVALIPVKRVHPAEMQFMERQELMELFRSLPKQGRHALRDRTLLSFLYNTGARVQEVVELRRSHLDLGVLPRVQLHGKGDRRRVHGTRRRSSTDANDQTRNSTTRMACLCVVLTPNDTVWNLQNRAYFCHCLDSGGAHPRHVSPHLFRHTAAVHLLESGVDINVIRGWLGHASLETTNRYAEITIRMKQAALKLCEPPVESSAVSHRKSIWKDDETLLAWLNSL